LAILLAGSAAAAADTYTHLWFNVTPSAIPSGGSVTIQLGTADNSVVPPGGSNFQCSYPCLFPYIPPGPACDDQSQPFQYYVVTQVYVLTPNDPTGPDQYFLGTTTAPSITSSPITVTTGTINIPFGPETAPFTINGVQYEWWRTQVNGAPGGGGSIITSPSPAPTGLTGKYTIDVEGNGNYGGGIQCGVVGTPFAGNFGFDIGFQISTPEFGSILVVFGLGVAGLLVFRKRILSTVPHV